MKPLKIHRLADLITSKNVWLGKCRAEKNPEKKREYIENIKYIEGRIKEIKNA